MTPSELRDSATPPAKASGPLTALWHVAKGDWDKAHDIVQADQSPEANWVHAHLHRVEGDASNAGYWYNRAGRPRADNPLDVEWDEIAGVLLAGHGLL